MFKRHLLWLNELKSFQYKKEYIPLLIINFLIVILPIAFIITAERFIIPLCIIILCNSVCCYINIKKFIETDLKIESIFLRSRADDTTRTHFSDDLINHINHIDNFASKEMSYSLLQKQAQLNAMQSQINPHFLYNTLDSIRGLAYSECAPATADMIEALSAFFRYSIGGTNDLVMLQQELKSIDNYMQIQKHRYNNRFEVIKQIDIDNCDIINYNLPKLTLQPLVENAIYHGLEKKTEGGIIIIKIITTQSRLIISIIDNGVGMDDATLRSLNEKFESNSITQTDNSDFNKSGVALMNVNARIKLLFGNNFGLIVYSTIGIGTEIQIILPLLEK